MDGDADTQRHENCSRCSSASAAMACGEWTTLHWDGRELRAGGGPGIVEALRRGGPPAAFWRLLAQMSANQEAGVTHPGTIRYFDGNTLLRRMQKSTKCRRQCAFARRTPQASSPPSSSREIGRRPV